MKLGDYLKRHGITQTEFAKRIGVSQIAVSRYVRGTRIPRSAVMQAIVLQTQNVVTAQDFYSDVVSD